MGLLQKCSRADAMILRLATIHEHGLVIPAEAGNHVLGHLSFPRGRECRFSHTGWRAVNLWTLRKK
jgi:hypothetical protein